MKIKVAALTVTVPVTALLAGCIATSSNGGSPTPHSSTAQAGPAPVTRADAAPGGPVLNYACHDRFNPAAAGGVTVVPDAMGTLIQGRVDIYCDPPPAPMPASQVIDLSLNHIVGGRPVEKGSGVDTTLPGIGGPSNATPYTVVAPCETGEWDFVYFITGLADDGQTFHYGPVMSTVHITACPA